jgi:hypothetical protein
MKDLNDFLDCLPVLLFKAAGNVVSFVDFSTIYDTYDRRCRVFGV